MIETMTDKEVFDEIVSRHGDVILIYPERKNPKTTTKILCRTVNHVEAPYELFRAMYLISEGQKGLIKDCFNNPRRKRL